MNTLINDPKYALYQGRLYDTTKATVVSSDGDYIDEFGTTMKKLKNTRITYDTIIEGYLLTRDDGSATYREISYKKHDKAQRTKLIYSIDIPSDLYAKLKYHGLSDNQIIQTLKGD